MLSRTLAIVGELTSPLSTAINHRLAIFSPSQVIVMTLAGYYVVSEAYDIYSNWNSEDLRSSLMSNTIQSLTTVPIIGPILEEKINEDLFGIIDDLQSDVDNNRDKWTAITELGKKGLSKADILKRFESLQANHRKGRNSGGVYTEFTEAQKELLAKIYIDTALTNPMHSDWPLINLMEAEILSICHELLRSPLKGLRQELHQVKNSLKEISQTALDARKDLIENQSLLQQELDALLHKLPGINTTTAPSLTSRIKQVKKELKNIPKQAIRESEYARQYSDLSKIRMELERKTRNPGIMTHGGSTSILESCKAHVFYARQQGISQPMILVPESAHAAFDKAGKTLHARVVKIPCNKETGQLDLTAMERAIKWNKKHIALIVGSAPSFPYGIIDPISELAALAMQHNIPLHVDACLGGFLTAFAKEAKIDLLPCDFSVNGVSSISIDTHKYGQTPKGSSVLLFHPDCPASSVHTHLDWAGGLYVTQGLDGSRSGADIATTWVALNQHGADHYVEQTYNIIHLRQAIEDNLRQINGLIIAYDHSDAIKLNVIGIRAEPGINLLHVENHMKENGWPIQTMQTRNNQIDGLHFCLTSEHCRHPHFVNEFAKALQMAFEHAKNHPYLEVKGTVKAYGLLSGIPTFLKEEVGKFYTGSLSAIRPKR